MSYNYKVTSVILSEMTQANMYEFIRATKQACFTTTALPCKLVRLF